MKGHGFGQNDYDILATQNALDESSIPPHKCLNKKAARLPANLTSPARLNYIPFTKAQLQTGFSRPVRGHAQARRAGDPAA